MDEIKWFYPESIDEATQIYASRKSIYHAGGTFILMSKKFPQVEAIVDLWHLPLDYFDLCEDTFEIGATNTYSAAVEKISAVKPDHILAKSLSAAASPPLRNRITIGGSLRAAPAWSDLIGPLVALDASVKLAKDGEKSQVPAEEYLANPAKYRNHLIVGIAVPANHWQSGYIRKTRTRVDFAAFNITALWQKNPDGTIKDIRIVAVGAVPKIARLRQLEDALRGVKPSDLNLAEKIQALDIKFADKPLGSGEYLKHLFAVELENLLRSI